MHAIGQLCITFMHSYVAQFLEKFGGEFPARNAGAGDSNASQKNGLVDPRTSAQIRGKDWPLG